MHTLNGTRGDGSTSTTALGAAAGAAAALEVLFLLLGGIDSHLQRSGQPLT